MSLKTHVTCLIIRFMHLYLPVAKAHVMCQISKTAVLLCFFQGSLPIAMHWKSILIVITIPFNFG